MNILFKYRLCLSLVLLILSNNFLAMSTSVPSTIPLPGMIGSYSIGIKDAMSLLKRKIILAPGQNTMLLHGVPGTGKTEIMAVFATETNSVLLYYVASELGDIYKNSTSLKIKEIFAEAKEIAGNGKTVVICIDEFEKIVSQVRATQTGAVEESNASTTLIAQLTQIQNNPNIFFIAATNAELKSLSKNVIDRIHFQIKINAPDAKMRKDLLQAYYGFSYINRIFSSIDLGKFTNAKITPPNLERINELKQLLNATNNSCRYVFFSSDKKVVIKDCHQLLAAMKTKNNSFVELNYCDNKALKETINAIVSYIDVVDKNCIKAQKMLSNDILDYLVKQTDGASIRNICGIITCIAIAQMRENEPINLEFVKKNTKELLVGQREARKKGHFDFVPDWMDDPKCKSFMGFSRDATGIAAGLAGLGIAGYKVWQEAKKTGVTDAAAVVAQNPAEAIKLANAALPVAIGAASGVVSAGVAISGGPVAAATAAGGFITAKVAAAYGVIKGAVIGAKVIAWLPALAVL